MLNDSLSKLDDIIQKYGKKGLRQLVLFKLLKKRTIEKIRGTYPTVLRIDMEFLNRVCMEKAYQIVRKGGENPTEEDVKEVLREITTS